MLTDWVALLPYCFFEFNHVEDENIADTVLRTRCRSLNGNAAFSFVLTMSTHKNQRKGKSLRWKPFASVLSADEMSFIALWPLAQHWGSPRPNIEGKGWEWPPARSSFLLGYWGFAATNEGFILCRTHVPGTNRAPKRRLTWQSSLRGYNDVIYNYVI